MPNKLIKFLILFKIGSGYLSPVTGAMNPFICHRPVTNKGVLGTTPIIYFYIILLLSYYYFIIILLFLNEYDQLYMVSGCV